MPNKSNIYAKLTIFIIVIGVIIRFGLAIPYHISGDACWHATNSKFIAENLKMPLYEPLGRDQPFWSPPLFNIISAAFYGIFGVFGASASELGLKLVSPIFSS